jgi:hypothetical protein
MPREKANFRDELEQINTFFPTKRILNVTDVAWYTGKTWHWCKKTYNIDPKKGITNVALAKLLCE